MKYLYSLLLFLFSVSAFGLEVKCFADYHVLALYQDNTGSAVEREQRSFVLNYEKGKLDAHSFHLNGYQMGALTGAIFSSAQAGGPSDFIEGVVITIMNPSTQHWTETVAPLSSHENEVTVSLRGQPGVLPNETSRSYFWSIACRWP